VVRELPTASGLGEAMSEVSRARQAAFSILKTLENHGHSDTLLRGRNVDALSDVDRGLATALVLGVLRWQIDLDRRIRPLLKHPNAKLDLEVLIALRLGAFQMLHMERIPARAAIDESVELTKLAGHKFASGMVNAVLRRLAAAPRAASPGGARTAYPAWMVERWNDLYGEDATSAICRYGQQQPSIHVRLSGDAVEDELVAEGIELAPDEFLATSRSVISGDVTKTTAFLSGRIRIQDEGSQLIAELALRGARILDCCAAPGGKTLILAERNPDAKIVAHDGNEQRLSQLRKRLESLSERVECRLADATQLSDEAAFEVVLADVPCSGTGTLGRNPEIRHRLRPEDLPGQASRQKAILQSALRALRSGGHVLYSTCSLEPEENEQVIQAVLAQSTNARLVPLQSRIEELLTEGILTQSGAERLSQSLTSQGYLRLIPGAFHTDGFFAALIEKMC